MSARGRVTAFEIREALDEAVRRLSVNVEPIQDRVRASAMVIFESLVATDFAFTEDRSLFDAIGAAVAHASGCHADQPGGVCCEMSDASAEKIASDILDLRDTAMGRALKDARVTERTGLGDLAGEAGRLGWARQGSWRGSSRWRR